MRDIPFIPYTNVRLQGFWLERQRVNAAVTRPAVYRQFERTGRFAALDHKWRAGEPNRPHIFFDSDTAKWIEGAAVTLRDYPDAEVEAQIDALAEKLAAGITPDGYFNSYYQTMDASKRFTERGDHELYCVGHWIEAGVAYAEATGKTLLLELTRRMARYVRDVFVTKKDAAFDTPGHEEIELALMRLAAHTGETEWRDLSAHFINARGVNKGEQNFNEWFDERYAQDQAPVREQETAEGHAVRWGYLYAAAAELARETGDEALMDACRRVFEDVVTRKLYVTGGVGNLRHGEAFGPAYALPNFMAYAETCASIAFAFFAARLLRAEPKAVYADMIELEMYNGVLAGVSLNGASFFYENPLEMRPDEQRFLSEVKAVRRPVTRQEYFDCSCCPPNVLRFIGSLGGLFCGLDSESRAVFVHQYAEGEAAFDMPGSGSVLLRQQTLYPWDGAVRFTVEPETEGEWTLALRLPGWCPNPKIDLPGEVLDGYYYIRRRWRSGDTVACDFPMSVQLIEAHPRVAADCGRLAVKRGPLVYCAEQADNGENLADLTLMPGAAEAVWQPELLGGVTAVSLPARRRKDFNGLYRFADAADMLAHAPEQEAARVVAVPYYAWGNRGAGEMAVWLLRP